MEMINQIKGCSVIIFIISFKISIFDVFNESFEFFLIFLVLCKVCVLDFQEMFVKKKPLLSKLFLFALCGRYDTVVCEDFGDESVELKE